MALPSLSVLLSLVPVCWVRTNSFPVYHNHSSAIAWTFSMMEVAMPWCPDFPEIEVVGPSCHIERLEKHSRHRFVSSAAELLRVVHG
ncbi:uncharacterized protein BDW47DRAFT_99082 [Aspergillus candidus]|uniref:Secreted protein n=1 Tax=Aspergillus candidus TaxID=41067 RepID=A0A2I2FLG4_ASPCN|nr:hypothetical protein BDW47DRAFT_99082 [Aspergillus candidus]PLB41444.1 hypothetical protein BDW47DRAFT_99082 [Aspergillus candidus]